jgi:predicted NUDIX family NTP pyrophosphohydrolase
MYRFRDEDLQVLLAHPGGPRFQTRDEGVWSIPKGELDPGESLLDAAQREFEEETGIRPHGPYTALTPIQQKGGKIVYAWAFAGDCDTRTIRSDNFTMQWPPGSGRQMEFPEVDRAEFFGMSAAQRKIKAAQWDLVVELDRRLRDRSPRGTP